MTTIRGQAAAKSAIGDSNRRKLRAAGPRVANAQLGLIAEARRDMMRIAKDNSPAAMTRICEMGGLIPGVPPATSEAIQFAACVEVLNRAHGRARLSMDDMSAQPLVVDFCWRDEPAPQLLEAEPGD